MQCSRCKTTLPKWRKPTSLGQLLLGGWTCQGCQAALDHQGRELAESYHTVAAFVVSLLFFGGIGLSNYLIFGAGLTGLSMVTLIVTLILGILGARLLQPKVRKN